MLEAAARDLEPLLHEIVFLGGAATGLLLTDPAAPSLRITQDIDIIIEVASLPAYHGFVNKLRNAGFSEDADPDAPICRWKKERLVLDVMPTDPGILGFGNRWFSKAFARAAPHRLFSGRQIGLVPAPLFLATKIEAFQNRANHDYVLSTDMEDILTLIDGRPELIPEISQSENELKSHLNDFFSAIRHDPAFIESVQGHLPPDPASQARAAQIFQRLDKIIEQTG